MSLTAKDYLPRHKAKLYYRVTSSFGTSLTHLSSYEKARAALLPLVSAGRPSKSLNLKISQGDTARLRG